MVHLKPSTSRRTSGFTLIELLVVITIVGVLLAVLLPTLQEARKVAYTAVCASNLRQLSVATHSYVVDQRDSALPLTYRFSFGWGVRLSPYLGREHPGLRTNPEDNGNYSSLFTQWRVFRCPENKSARRAGALYYHWNYGYNGILTSGVLGGGNAAHFAAAWLNERRTMQRIDLPPKKLSHML
jgi:prepilin-type N-terminal cleavage/methylation domain-containing protein